MTDWTLNHPLRQTHARATMLHEHLKIAFGAPPEAGWHTIDALFAAGAPQFDAQVAATQARLRTKAPAVVGSALVQSYQWPLIAFAVACYLFDRRVPDLRPQNTRVHFHAEGHADGLALLGGSFTALPTDAQASHCEARVVADEAALRAALRGEIEGHLGTVIAYIGERLRCKPRGLWLNVADSLAGTLVWLMAEHDKATPLATAEAALDTFIRTPGSPLHTKQIGLFTLTYREHTQIHHERATCCYWYKTEGGEYCSTCPHRTAEDRTERLLNYMAEEYATA